jgi:undecaprenyl-diphosphatase
LYGERFVDLKASRFVVRRFRVLALVISEIVKANDRPVLLLSTVAFLVCSAAAGAGLFRPPDVKILGLAQEHTSGGMDAVGLITSVVGGVEFITVAAVALAAGLFFEGRGRLAARLLAAFVVTGLIEVVFKMVVPQAPVPGEAMRGTDPSLLDISTPYPYPSGHMLRSVLLLGAVYLLWPNRAGRVAILLFLVASAASRLYLGAHWPSDVLGGALLGIAGLAWAFDKRSAVNQLADKRSSTAEVLKR